MSDIMMAAVVTAAVIIALASAIAAAVMYMKQRRVMGSIEEMLETARKGSFTEHDLDESRFSALENRFADYLATSEISAQRVKSEKDKIKFDLYFIFFETGQIYVDLISGIRIFDVCLHEISCMFAIQLLLYIRKCRKCEIVHKIVK